MLWDERRKHTNINVPIDLESIRCKGYNDGVIPGDLCETIDRSISNKMDAFEFEVGDPPLKNRSTQSFPNILAH